MRQFLSFLIIILQVVFFSNSSAQLVWEKDAGNPIPLNANTSAWNRHVFFPKVLYNPDSSRYEMWFTASAGPSTADWRPYRIGFATSTDGVNWVAHPDPVLEPDAGTWDEYTIDHATVLRENGTYKMWYTGWSSSSPEVKIGYATSPNGKTWQKHANPIMGPGSGAWEAGGVGYCTIMPVQGGGYKMWYAGLDKPLSDVDSVRTGYTTSTDGISWQRMNEPVLTPGSPGDWDEAVVGATQVLIIQNTYYMWYFGNRQNMNPRHTGVARSSNGINWMKYNNPTTVSTPYVESDPVLSPSPAHWDGNFAEAHTVMLNRTSDSLYMWYDGSREPTGTYLWRIGLAKLSLDTLLKYLPLDADDISEYDAFEIPKLFSLSQNYPNPFNPSTIIQYTLPKNEDVQIMVYNTLGQVVWTFSERQVNAGIHQVEYHAQNLSSGVYFYRINAGEFQDVKKMILIK